MSKDITYDTTSKYPPHTTREDLTDLLDTNEKIMKYGHIRIEEYKQQLKKKVEEMKDKTPDADEYERADRIAWNQALDQVLKLLGE